MRADIHHHEYAPPIVASARTHDGFTRLIFEQGGDEMVIYVPSKMADIAAKMATMFNEGMTDASAALKVEGVAV